MKWGGATCPYELATTADVAPPRHTPETTMRVLRSVDAALNRAGLWITSVVGTMWCALAFAILSLVSLPGALASGSVVVIVGWVAQTFLQLVLLSVIMVGQAAESAKTEARDQETHDTVMAELAELRDLTAALHAKIDDKE